MRFDECKGWATGSHDKRINCPPNIEYPSPPAKVKLLFIGWNPPGPSHFWNNRGDNFLNDMTWVFEQLGWLHKSDLWQVFGESSFYLVHAVKCWQEAKFLWNVPGLVETCPRNLLLKNIEELNPETICAMGKLPHKALSTIWPSEVPAKISLGKGWCKNVQGRKVIITTFPNWHWNASEKWANRECTVRALGRWMEVFQNGSESEDSFGEG
jgi:hypothetical protein